MEQGTRRVSPAGSTMDKTVASVHRMTGLIGDVTAVADAQNDEWGPVRRACDPPHSDTAARAGGPHGHPRQRLGTPLSPTPQGHIHEPSAISNTPYR